MNELASMSDIDLENIKDRNASKVFGIAKLLADLSRQEETLHLQEYAGATWAMSDLIGEYEEVEREETKRLLARAEGLRILSKQEQEKS